MMLDVSNDLNINGITEIGEIINSILSAADSAILCKSDYSDDAYS